MRRWVIAGCLLALPATALAKNANSSTDEGFLIWIVKQAGKAMFGGGFEKAQVPPNTTGSRPQLLYDKDGKTIPAVRMQTIPVQPKPVSSATN
jgi:hypothetical protein